VKWYNSHLKKNMKAKCLPEAVLITNDRANREKARAEGMKAYTVYEYVRSLTEHPSLLDSLARNGVETDEGEKAVKERLIFPEHLPLSTIQTGLKSGRYLQGVFQGSRENYLEGFVRVESSEGFIFVHGLSHLNRAIHGDIVAIEMLPESDWSAPSGMVTKVAESVQEAEVEEDANDGADSNSTGGKDGTGGKEESKDHRKVQPTCRVVGIIKRNWRTYCGTLLPLSHSSMGSTRRHTFIPADRSVPRVRLETRQADTLVGKRILINIDSWPRTSRFPRGHFVRVLGEIGDKETETEVLLLEHDVPHQSFSSSVLADLPQMPWQITSDDLQSRRDLRHIDICSVDPPGCTDIDDALHCRELENGRYEVGVHIADVSHFIRHGSSLDKEAENRGTTVYLTDKRIDMVPDLLSSNLCSLRGGEERFAFSVVWQMTATAEIISAQFFKSVIRSRAALTYAEAQMRIDDPNLSDDVTQSLRHLNGLAKILKKKRINNGALTLASPEVRFEVDSETHDPVDLQMKELKETNSLVEEFMLLANISVAKRIYEEFPHCALLRRHPSPPLSNYDILIKAGACKEVEIAVESAKALATSLDKAVLQDQPYFNTMLRIMATRCMMQALYFCSGVIPVEDFHHYGLATPIYTHFTSPIRRYSDLVVHRLLAVAIQADTTYADLLNKETAQRLCNHLNQRHKNAQYAARASINLHTHLFFKKRDAVEEAFVLFVKKNAIQVLIPKFGLESTIFFDDVKILNGDGGTRRLNVLFSETDPSLTVEGVTFCLFDKLQVGISVERSNIQHSKLRLRLVSPSVPGMGENDNDSDLAPPLAKRTKML
jgi:exosome complex exonuclease DIS3/RRP44